MVASRRITTARKRWSVRLVFPLLLLLVTVGAGGGRAEAQKAEVGAIQELIYTPPPQPPMFDPDLPCANTDDQLRMSAIRHAWQDAYRAFPSAEKGYDQALANAQAVEKAYAAAQAAAGAGQPGAQRLLSSQASALAVAEDHLSEAIAKLKGTIDKIRTLSANYDAAVKIAAARKCGHPRRSSLPFPFGPYGDCRTGSDCTPTGPQQACTPEPGQGGCTPGGPAPKCTPQSSDCPPTGPAQPCTPEPGAPSDCPLNKPPPQQQSQGSVLHGDILTNDVLQGTGVAPPSAGQPNRSGETGGASPNQGGQHEPGQPASGQTGRAPASRAP
jgi:hypothetical protein